MATRNLSFPYVLKQNKNDMSTGYGKYYAETYSPKSALSLKGLIQLVAMDQSVFTEEIAKGVIDILTVVMSELLQSAQSVKWDGLGTFRPTVESSGASSPNDYDVNVDVKGIHIRFIPTNDKGEELTSRKFAELLTFTKYGLKETRKVTKPSGKTGYAAKITPSATLDARRKLPILQTVDGAAPSSTIAIAAAGSELAFSGGQNGITYNVKRDGVIIATKTLTSDGHWDVNTEAQTADATAKPLTVEWTAKGRQHVIACGNSVIA